MASTSVDVPYQAARLFTRMREAGTFEGVRGVALLKQLCSRATQIFTVNPVFEPLFTILGKELDAKSKVRQAAVTNNFHAIAPGDFTPEFFKVYGVAHAYQEFVRCLVVHCLDQLDHGFSPFDAALLRHAAHVSSAYDAYYTRWCREVACSPAAAAVKARDTSAIDPDLFNHYTIIQVKEDGTLHDLPLYAAMKDEVDAVAAAMAALIAAISAAATEDDHHKYVEYFTHYRACLLETDRSKLEGQWCHLDRLWMGIKYHIQIVHDIEYGYGDPLRTKAIPDFSIRFVDDTYADANATIARIQSSIADYFALRDTDLAHKGLFALRNSFAAIYFLPFQCGMSLHFRFSGQSIPNRSEVKDDLGVKIYFDPVSTALRVKATAALVREVVAEPERFIPCLRALDIIVFHVAPHEVGHAIYGLDQIKDSISVSTKTLLEEPRAELTALFAMHRLVNEGMLCPKHARDSLLAFALSDLRRFASYNSTTTRPYTISALFTWRLYEKEGFLTVKNDKIAVDMDKADSVLARLSEQFEEVLRMEDAADGEGLEALLQAMQQECGITKWLVGKLNKDVQ